MAGVGGSTHTAYTLTEGPAAPGDCYNGGMPCDDVHGGVVAIKGNKYCCSQTGNYRGCLLGSTSQGEMFACVAVKGGGGVAVKGGGGGPWLSAALVATIISGGLV